MKTATILMLLYSLGTLILAGCNLLEVQVSMTQRSIMDKGDGTKDSYLKSGDNKLEKERTETVIKTIP